VTWPKTIAEAAAEAAVRALFAARMATVRRGEIGGGHTRSLNLVTWPKTIAEAAAEAAVRALFAARMATATKADGGTRRHSASPN
jgi:hypothetical protein